MKLTRYFSLVLCAVLLAALVVLPASRALARPLSVAVSVAPQQWAVEQVGGGLVSVLPLVPPGSDPHVYEPKPSQVAQLADADLYLTIGLEFEKAWLGRLAGANPHLHVVSMLGTDAPVPEIPEQHDHHAEAQHDHHAGHHHHEGLDPHVWTSPKGMARMLDGTLAELVRLDPDNAVQYREGHARAMAEVHELDREIHQVFDPIPADRRVFLVFHPAWGHFAQDYGLRQLSIQMEGKEPGPVELARVIREAKESNVKAVFIQPQMSRRTAGQVANALDGRVVRADPLALDWAQNLRSVARGFRVAMSGSGE